MGVAGWFEEFCSDLVINKTESISNRYNQITKRLNLEFWGTDSSTSHSLYVGSYGRNTAIRGFSDLDMVFELPVSLYYQYDAYSGNGQSALLQAVKTAMQKTYSTSNIGADGQVVVVSFMDDLTFEVVPVFSVDDGTYKHPDSNSGGSWKITNPRAEIRAIKDRNIACNRNLVKLCRMMRAWKNEWTVPIGGLLIDTLAYQFIENYAHRDKSYLYYDFMCRDFFDWLSGQPSEQTWWRAPGSAQYVYNSGGFQYKAKRCYNIAVDAISYESNNNSWSAKQQWRKIFGYAFPS